MLFAPVRPSSDMRPREPVKHYSSYLSRLLIEINFLSATSTAVIGQAKRFRYGKIQRIGKQLQVSFRLSCRVQLRAKAVRSYETDL